MCANVLPFRAPAHVHLYFPKTMPFLLLCTQASCVTLRTSTSGLKRTMLLIYHCMLQTPVSVTTMCYFMIVLEFENLMRHAEHGFGLFHMSLAFFKRLKILRLKWPANWLRWSVSLQGNSVLRPLQRLLNGPQKVAVDFAQSDWSQQARAAVRMSIQV